VSVPPIADERSSSVSGRTLGLALVALIALIIVRNAWLSDDAFITFRTVDNFVGGRGLTWNPGQRVQAFTHPAWFFLVSAAYSVSHEMFYSALGLSIAVSVLGLGLASEALAVNEWAALPALVGLGFSRAFIDYSSSGLENPLSHALLIAWLVCLVSPRHAALCPWFDLLTGLLLWNRLDLALLVGPAWCWSILRRYQSGVAPRRLFAQGLCAAAPLLAWFVFAIVYFGFALPNTAYAKLGIRIALGERFAQGFFYLLALVANDPASALLLLVGSIMIWRTRAAWRTSLLLGLLGYLLYIGYIGGDFMAGRFFAAPLLLAAAGLFRTPIDRSTSVVLASLFAVAGWAGPTPPVFSGASAEGRTGAKLELQRYRVMDERRFYYPDTGLLSADRLRPMPGGRFRGGLELANKRGVVVPQIGMRAFLAGPDAWLIDPFGLSDPFLARLPAFDAGPDRDWKAGHWKRPIPDGYRETIERGENHLSDPKLARLYAEMQLITSGPLWSLARFRAIWRLNSGQLDKLAVGAVGEDSDLGAPVVSP
jgi:arabinofuranosyltransferase